MRRLSQRVQPEQPSGDVDSLLGVAGLQMAPQQGRQRFDGMLLEARPLRTQPLLKELLIEGEALEEVASIERRCAFERAWRRLAAELVEFSPR